MGGVIRSLTISYTKLGIRNEELGIKFEAEDWLRSETRTSPQMGDANFASDRSDGLYEYACFEDVGVKRIAGIFRQQNGFYQITDLTT